MVIRNSTHTYVAVQKLESRSVEQYLCRRMNEGKWEECRLAIVPSQYAPELIPYLEQQRAGEKFKNLLDIFTDDRNLYIVTAVRTFLSLEERLAGQNCSLSERMTIMVNLLSELIVQGADDFFCCAALETWRIGISDSLEIGLQYDLDGILDHEQSVFAMTQYRLGQVVHTLFREEIKQESLTEIMELEGRLTQGTFSSLLELYGWFLPVAERWIAGGEKKLIPRSFWFRMWERVKFLASQLVWLWKLALILLAAWYLVLSVKSLTAEPAAGGTLKEIGTLKIQ